MKFTANDILKDKRVLYGVAGLSIVNMIGYLSVSNHEAIVFFFILLLVATRFTKNMIIALGVALIGSNVIAMMNKKRVHEGFDLQKKMGKVSEAITSNDTDETDAKPAKPAKPSVRKAKKDAKTKDAKTKDGFGNKKGGKKEAFSDGKHDIDFASTIEDAYNRIDTMLGPDGGAKWGSHMDRLFKKQNNLIGNINKMEPMIEKMAGMMGSTKKYKKMLGV